MFSLNERHIARELKEIWLTEHATNQLKKTKEFLKEIIGLDPKYESNPDT